MRAYKFAAQSLNAVDIHSEKHGNNQISQDR